MRRMPLLVGAALIVIASVPIANGASTQNSSFTATIAQAGWDTFDPETGTGEFSSLQVARDNGVTEAFLDRSIGEVVLCEGGATSTPNDDSYGFVGKEIHGSGPATLSVGRQYRSAKASGSLTVEVATYNECTGDFGSTTTTTITFAMTLNGVGPLIHESSRTSLRVPGELSAHDVVRGTLRQAAGSVKLGTKTFDAGGAIGQLTFRIHATVH